MEIINKILWSIVISIIIINSIYFSIKLRFPQVKLIKALKSIKNSKNNRISPIDTLIMSLSSKIGVGSLSGTAICIYYGGVGTIFWIMISTFFLSIITYIENELAIIYKERDGIYQKSGPVYYISKGLKNKRLSTIYAIIMMTTYAVLFSSIQNNTITILTTNIFNIKRVVVSLIITILTIIVINKGLKFISKICNKIFPIMIAIFTIIGLIILLKSLKKVPLLVKIIIKDAFLSKRAKSGIIYSFILALQKSIFANESGVGTSATMAGITDNNDYKLQGTLGIIQTYFINFIILGTTSLIIVTAKIKNINITNGIELTRLAMNYHLGNIGDIILLIILVLFSYSSIITIYYYGENCLKYLTQSKTKIKILKIVTIISIFIGGITKATTIWILIDIALAILTIINMYSIYKLREIIIIKNK